MKMIVRIVIVAATLAMAGLAGVRSAVAEGGTTCFMEGEKVVCAGR